MADGRTSSAKTIRWKRVNDRSFQRCCGSSVAHHFPPSFFLPIRERERKKEGDGDGSQFLFHCGRVNMCVCFMARNTDKIKSRRVCYNRQRECVTTANASGETLSPLPKPKEKKNKTKTPGIFSLSVPPPPPPPSSHFFLPSQLVHSHHFWLQQQ